MAMAHLGFIQAIEDMSLNVMFQHPNSLDIVRMEDPMSLEVIASTLVVKHDKISSHFEPSAPTDTIDVNSDTHKNINTD